MPLLKLMEVIGLPPLPGMLLYGLTKLKPTQAINFDVSDAKIWESGERASDQEMPRN